MSNRKVSSEFRRQLEGLGFQDSRNVREEQRRRELINNISLEYNLDVDENQSVEVLEEKYKKLFKSLNKFYSELIGFMNLQEVINNYQRFNLW